MLGRVPEVEDALGQRKILAEEFFQSVAAIGERDLLFGFAPTDLRRLAAQLHAQLVQLVKSRQIPHCMTFRGLWVVFAARVVEHAHIVHPARHFRAIFTLLSYSCGVEAHIEAMNRAIALSSSSNAPRKRS
jgi:hypothetical protein